MTGSTLERRLLHQSWDDGLIDLFFGVSLLLIGLAWQFDLVPLGAIGPALLVSIWKPTRQRLIEPRTGYAEPGAGTRGRLSRGVSMLLAVGVVSFLSGVVVYLFARQGRPVSLSGIVPGLPALIIAVGAMLASQAFVLPRFAAYAIVLAAAGAATIILGGHPAPSMLSGGLVVTVTGAALLARFIRRHPVAQEREA